MNITITPININSNKNFSKSKNINFGSTARSYEFEPSFKMCTSTGMFREDLDWKNFTKFLLEHFKDKKEVNIIQYASSDGSEAYTQIISLLENGQDTKKFFPIEAFDFDPEVVKAAQSGRLNLTYRDHQYLDINTNNFNKYFSRAKKALKIPNEGIFKFFTQDKKHVDYCNDFKTYNVSPVLKSRVNFNQGDMFKLVSEIEDNSNTVLLCRNSLGYFTSVEINSFLMALANKLKKDSIFAIGKVDTHQTEIEALLNKFNFEKVMNNVYKKL